LITNEIALKQDMIKGDILPYEDDPVKDHWMVSFASFLAIRTKKRSSPISELQNYFVI
jgi:hypothetical protein